MNLPDTSSYSTAIIMCNGRPPDKEWLKQQISSSTLVIGADGGANKLFDLNVSFHLAIGDLDSIRDEVKRAFPCLHKPDQESNDLEKCLHYCLSKQLSDVRIFGALGERLDHELKNLSVLLQFSEKFEKLKIQDERFSVIIANNEERIPTKSGKVFSLFPLSGTVEGIMTKGLKYPLNNEALINGSRDGSSNEAVSDEVVISYKSGNLLLFYER